MVADLLKRLAAGLPGPWQQELKRIHYRRLIRRGSFETSLPEYDLLATIVSAGDWVIDVGANVGHYTKRLSDLVGPAGRVIAVEPVPNTFAVLAANTLLFSHQNVTLVNLAASNTTTVAGMAIPNLDVGLRNYYQATLTETGADLEILTCALDSLALSRRIGLIKVDAEGHDGIVLEGATGILERDHPALLVEAGEPDLVNRLRRYGYQAETIAGSPNTLFRWTRHSAPESAGDR